jgi:hypothetical protein
MFFETQSNYGPIALHVQRANDGPITISVPASSHYFSGGVTYTINPGPVPINPGPVPGILVNGAPLSQYPVMQQRLHLAGLTGSVPNHN